MSRISARYLTASVAGLVLLAGTVFTTSAADLQKEGTIAHTLTWAGTYKLMELGEDQSASIAEFSIMIVGDATLGDISGDCLGMAALGRYEGYCSYVDADGDKFFEHQIEEVEGTGKTSLIGGTGKFEGIEGETEYEITFFSAPDGKTRGFGTKKGSYKLP